MDFAATYEKHVAYQNLETFVMAEMEEMKKYFEDERKKYHRNSLRLKTMSEGSEKSLLVISNLMLERLNSIKERISHSSDNELFCTEIDFVKRRIKLYRTVYETFTKELLNRTYAIPEIKKKSDFKLKSMDIEHAYDKLMHTLKKRLQHLEKGSKENAMVKVDNYIKVVNHQVNDILKTKMCNMENDGLLDLIPLPSTKINTVLEQIKDTESQIENLKQVKADAIQHLQKLQCSLKQKINPFSSSFRKQICADSAYKTISKIERDLSHIMYEFNNLMVELKQHKATLERSLRELQKLNVLLNILIYKSCEAQQQYQRDTEKLQLEKLDLLSKSNSEDQHNLIISEIESKSKELERTHSATHLSLKAQIKEIEAEMKAKETFENIKSNSLERICSYIAVKSEKTLLTKDVIIYFKQFLDSIFEKYDD